MLVGLSLPSYISCGSALAESCRTRFQTAQFEAKDFGQGVIASDRTYNTELWRPRRKTGQDLHGNGGKGLSTGVVAKLERPSPSRVFNCNRLYGITGCARPCPRPLLVGRECGRETHLTLAISLFLLLRQSTSSTLMSTSRMVGLKTTWIFQHRKLSKRRLAFYGHHD